VIKNVILLRLLKFYLLFVLYALFLPFIKQSLGVYTDQDDFLNIAVRIIPDCSPPVMLDRIKKIEKDMGRQESRVWGPRKIDIDIAIWANIVMEAPNLFIPHARLSERDFFLKPLIELTPSLRDPRTKERLLSLLKKIPDEEKTITGSYPFLNYDGETCCATKT
jgi:2-amino-4-hydroxy-6-hydroxymethyldihydropteridine diphosphokinase